MEWPEGRALIHLKDQLKLLDIKIPCNQSSDNVLASAYSGGASMSVVDGAEFLAPGIVKIEQEYRERRMNWLKNQIISKELEYETRNGPQTSLNKTFKGHSKHIEQMFELIDSEIDQKIFKFLQEELVLDDQQFAQF